MKIIKCVATASVFALLFSASLSSKKLNATPIAGTDRLQVILAMGYQSNVKWSSSKDIQILRKRDNNGNYLKDSYSKNTTYYGLPYSQVANDSIGTFISICNGSNGAATLADVIFGNKISLKDSYLNSHTLSSCSLGNDCSTAVALAWASRCSGMDYAGISTLDFLSCAQIGSNSSYHMKTLGGYSIGNKYTTEYCNTTNDSIRQKVYGYYDQLKSGDSLFYRKSSKGHAMLVTSTGKDYVIVTEQCGLSGTSSWKTSKKYTYDELYNKGYLPVYCTGYSRY
ncbi:MAG: hypothetical protein J5607_03705 [Clostridiales bacterium]|nr:hypothetical protein [Clostridiales bacterium]MBR4818934.1 hypothetical protein [Clostridiales bacterium]